MLNKSLYIIALIISLFILPACRPSQSSVVQVSEPVSTPTLSEFEKDGTETAIAKATDQRVMIDRLNTQQAKKNERETESPRATETPSPECDSNQSANIQKLMQYSAALSDEFLDPQFDDIDLIITAMEVWYQVARDLSTPNCLNEAKGHLLTSMQYQIDAVKAVKNGNENKAKANSRRAVEEYENFENEAAIILGSSL